MIATRRNMLIGTAIVAVAALTLSVASGRCAAGTPVEHPDAALIALCATFTAACAELARINTVDDPSDEELDALVAAWHAPIAAIIATPATTLAGARAKAQAVINYFGNSGRVSKYNWETVEEAMSGHEKMAWNLAHEIVAMGSAVS